MSLPYLFTLSSRARIAYPIIQRGVRSGLSSRSIATELTSGGIGIRRSDLLGIMRRERDIIKHGLNLRFLPLDRAPNPERLPEALTRLRRKYSYEISIRGTVSNVNLPYTPAVTVASSKLLTRRQAEALGLEAAIAGSDRYNIVIESVLLTNVLQAGPFGTQF